MNIIELYSILFVGLLVVNPTLRLIFHSSRISRCVKVAFERFVRYPLIVKGDYWTSVTRLELLLFVAFLACNVFALVFRLSGARDLEQRAAIVCAINITPLFLNGKPNPLIDLVGVPLPVYHLVHHWVGRVAIIEGLLHGALTIGRSGGSQLQVSGCIVSQIEKNVHSLTELIGCSVYVSHTNQLDLDRSTLLLPALSSNPHWNCVSLPWRYVLARTPPASKNQ